MIQSSAEMTLPVPDCLTFFAEIMCQPDFLPLGRAAGLVEPRAVSAALRSEFAPPHHMADLQTVLFMSPRTTRRLCHHVLQVLPPQWNAGFVFPVADRDAHTVGTSSRFDSERKPQIAIHRFRSNAIRRTSGGSIDSENSA